MFRSLIQLLFPPPPPRRRRRTVASVAALESRQLLAGARSGLVGAAQGSRAAVGELLWISDPIPVTDPRGFATNGTTTLVAGNNGGVGYVYELSPSGGGATVGDGEVLLDEVAAGSSGAVASRSFVQGIGVVDGKLIPFGAGFDFDGRSKGTYWTAADSPTLASRTSNGSGLLGVSSSGLMFGALSDTAAIGVIETDTSPIVPIDIIPGIQGATFITSVSGDSQLLSGSLLFWRAEDGTLTVINPSGWEIPPEVLGLPGSFREAVVYGENHYVAADCTTLGFDNVVCVWNVETGQLVATTEVGDQLVDFQEFDGHVGLIVNGEAGAAVYLDLDFATRTELSDRLGMPVTAENRTGLNTGGLGMVLEIDGQYRAAVFELLTEPVHAVESAVHQGNYAPNVLSLGTKTFEVGLRGSATLDVTQLDKTSLFIGDERNTASGKIISIKYTDENKDGFKDAVIKVQTAGTVRADTTRLRITGRTTTGDEFTGSRDVVVTAQTWQAHWQAISGSSWRISYTLFNRGLKKTWW